MANTLVSSPKPAVQASGSRNRISNDARTVTGTAIAVSIVIPFHNEQGSARHLLDECLRVIDSMAGNRGEIVAIDDGSDDNTAAILNAAAASDARIRVLTFQHNRGQAPALYYGLEQARGVLLVTLDGDGQNNPADIPAMIEHLQSSGADLVSGIRVRRCDSVLRRSMSRLANRVRGIVLNDGVTDSGCALKVFHRSVIETLIPIQTLYSFIPALARAAGKRVIECPVDHRQRIGGRTHYGLSVFLWRPALDMLGVWWFSRRRFAEAELIDSSRPAQ